LPSIRNHKGKKSLSTTTTLLVKGRGGGSARAGFRSGKKDGKECGKLCRLEFAGGGRMSPSFSSPIRKGRRSSRNVAIVLDEKRRRGRKVGRERIVQILRQMEKKSVALSISLKRKRPLRAHRVGEKGKRKRGGS